jgi:hypothetical protein
LIQFSGVYPNGRKFTCDAFVSGIVRVKLIELLEVDIYKDDGSCIKNPLDAEKLDVF